MTTDAQPDVAGLLADLENGAEWCEERSFRAVMRRAAAALAHLQGENERLVQGLGTLTDANMELCRRHAVEVARANAAERRVARLEEVLRKMVDAMEPADASPYDFEAEARAALDQTEATRRGERGDEP
jgi:hypothetical protein